jgi:hypothetical protein
MSKCPKCQAEELEQGQKICDYCDELFQDDFAEYEKLTGQKVTVGKNDD